MVLPLAALFALSASGLVAAQAPTKTFPDVPLAQKTFADPAQLPEKVDTDVGLIRGTQKGYNRCNATTENQDSLCQTSWVTSIDDFCLWAPSEPESVVADTEGEMVAWCTKPGHGTRLIPEGALQGVQVLRSPAYIAIVGFVDQSKINIKSDDWGGEMDPHGADLRGNPMGGVMFSQAFGGTKQVIEWHNFMGGNAFCLKACDQANPDAAKFCEHRLDRIGCAYNVPNAAKNGTFETCASDNQDFPGIYTDASGAVQTYTQPPEDQGAISTMPYQPKVPSSSQCTTVTSSAIYTGLPKPTATPGGSAAPSGTGAGATSRGGSGSAAATGTRSGTAAGASATSGAQTMAISMVSVMGLVAAAVFLS